MVVTGSATSVDTGRIANGADPEERYSAAGKASTRAYSDGRGLQDNWCSVASDTYTYCCGFGARASCVDQGLVYSGPDNPCEVRLVTGSDGTTTCEGVEGESGNVEGCDCEDEDSDDTATLTPTPVFADDTADADGDGGSAVTLAPDAAPTAAPPAAPSTSGSPPSLVGEAPTTAPHTPAPTAAEGALPPVVAAPSSCGATESFQITSSDLPVIEGCFRSTNSSFANPGSTFEVWSVDGDSSDEHIAVFGSANNGTGAVDDEYPYYVGFLYDDGATPSKAYCYSEEEAISVHPADANWLCDLNGTGSYVDASNAVSFNCGCVGTAGPAPLAAILGGSIAGALFLGGLTLCIWRKRRRGKNHAGLLVSAATASTARPPVTRDYVKPKGGVAAPREVVVAAELGESGGSDVRTTGSTRRSLSEGEDKGRGRTMQDALRVVVDSAIAVADKSSMPFVPEIASFLGVLANLSRNFDDNEQSMPKTVRWCGFMLEMLDESNIHKDGTGPVTDLLEEVHDAVAELVQVVTCFLRKGKLGRALTSTLYKKRQETAEGGLRDALQRLQAGVALVSMNMLEQTKAGVHELIARSGSGSERWVSRKERKRTMMEHQEIDPGLITYFDDMVLGTGGYATVQLVEYQETTAVAKVVNMPEVGAGARAAEKVTKMFVNELHAMLELRSPFTVNVFGAVTSTPGRLVLVMEFMEGGDLRSFLNAANAPLDNGLVYRLARDIAGGMQFLHSKHAIHGDLKSPNVLLTGNNRAKIADFGTTRTMEEITSMDTKGGGSWRHGTTLKWAAPEVLNDEPVRAKSDVYSYGVVVWEIVSRRVPWQDSSLNQLLVKVCRGERPDVPEETPTSLSSLIARCWAHRPEDRISFDEVVGFLMDVQGQRADLGEAG